MTTTVKAAMLLAATMTLGACVVDDAGPASPAVQPVETAQPQAGWRSTVYRCAGGQTLRASYSPAGDQVRIEQTGESILLRQVRSGSGVRYEAADPNYTYVLTTKGNTADLWEGNDRPIISNCVS